MGGDEPKPKKEPLLALPWLPSPKKEARELLRLWCLSSPPKMEREELLWCLSLWCLSSVAPKREAAIPGRWEEERLAWCRPRELERERERCLCFESECLEEEWWCL